MSGLADLLSDLAATRPDDLAVAVGDTETSVGELAERAWRLGDRLRESGLRRGQPVAVVADNSVGTVAALFGVWAAGGVFVPLNPRATATETDHVLEVIPPAVVVDGSASSRRYADVPVLGGDAASRNVDVLDPEIALATFTSGTTGRPKAVLLTHDGVLRLIDGVLEKLRAGRPTKPGGSAMPNLVPVSLALWAGIYTILFAFRTSAPVVVMEQFDTTAFAGLVARYRLRSTVLPPAAMTMLADDDAITDLTPLRYVRSITAPLSPLQARRFGQKFGVSILNGYGQTELGGEVIGWNTEDLRTFGETKLGAVGRPHQGVELRVDDHGELWVRAPAMSAGYATGDDLGERLSPDGFLRTGDLARVDDDGFVWIEGRVSDMVNRGGLKVYPAEIEEVLRLSPAVAEVAVVGVPDARLGEVPWAFVVPDDHGSPSSEELDALAREHLAPYKVPASFVMVDSLPRNDVGKVVAAELVALATRN